ncbi:hypothetical protein [Haladaptatus sp. NG-WS-4]
MLNIASRRSFSIDSDPVPDGLPATVTADLLATETAKQLPRIRVRFECTADEARTFRFGYPDPFADTTSVVDDGAKLLLQYEATSDDRRSGCWKTRNLAGQDAVEYRTLAPGERTHVEWSVLNHAKNEACFPDGRYRFEDQYGVGGETYAWGFLFKVR